MVLNGSFPTLDRTDHKVEMSPTVGHIWIRVLVHIIAYSKPRPGDLILPFNDKVSSDSTEQV